MIERRQVLAAGVVGAALFAAAPANACSIVASRRVPFSERECLTQLARWVAVLNDGPSLSTQELQERVDALSVDVDDDELLYRVLTDRARDPDHRSYTFYKEFRLSGGQADPRPILLAETNRIRRLRSRATYQFTLQRYRYIPAVRDEEAAGGSCETASDAHYRVERTAYLATFWNNRMQTVKLFPEWYLEDAA